MVAECGKTWLKTRIVYLHGSPSELLAAIIACVYFSAAAVAVAVVRNKALEKVTNCDPLYSYTLPKKVVLVVSWTVIVVILSAPSSLYAATTSIPPDENTLNLGTTTLSVFHNGAGVLLFLVTAFAIPLLANELILHLNNGISDRHTALHLIMSARLMVALVIPFAFIIVLHQDCYAHWLASLSQ